MGHGKTDAWARRQVDRLLTSRAESIDDGDEGLRKKGRVGEDSAARRRGGKPAFALTRRERSSTVLRDMRTRFPSISI